MTEKKSLRARSIKQYQADFNVLNSVPPFPKI